MKNFLLGVKIIILTALVVYPVHGFCAEIPSDTAMEVAENYLQSSVAMFGKWSGSSPSITGIELIKYKGTPVAYNVKVSPRGHLLIPYYDDFSPVLLYSDTSEFIPARVQQKGSIESWILSEIYDTYNVIKKKRGALNRSGNPIYDGSRVANAWKAFRGTSSESRAAVISTTSKFKFATLGPLLTTTWDQPSPYNLYTPGITGSCTHTLTGCVATAWSQLMKYWNWPDSGTGSYSYSWNGQILSADFNHAYNWASMPNNLTESSSASEKDAVARLISDVGISADMDYGCDSSGSNAYANDVLDIYFKYKSTMQQIGRGTYTANEWFNLFKAEFDAQPPRPIILSIFTSQGGHEVVADGYQTGTTDMVHVNLGWSGSYNGYYDVTNNWTTGSYTWEANSQVIVTHIEPDNQTSAPVVLSTVPVNGSTGVALTTPITATFSKAMNASTITSSTFYLDNGVTGTVSYNSTTNTATFTPSSPSQLTANTVYHATINTGVTDMNNNPLAADKIWSFTTGGSNSNLIVNGDFESGTTGWNQSNNAILYSNGSYSHGGSGYAWLGGYEAANDILYQDVAIPANSTAVLLQFWYEIATQDTGMIANDIFTVTVRNPVNGAVLQTLSSMSNLNATVDWTQSPQYDLTAYKGQTIRLTFTGTTNSDGLNTNFFLDDVQLTATNSTSYVRIPGVGSYDTFQSAYNSASSVATIQSQAVSLPASNFNLNMGKTILLQGGYDSIYSSNSGGYTTMNGVLTIGNGSLTLENLIVR